MGEVIDRFETRGTPAGDATAAFQLMADRGFNLGQDKNFNKMMAKASKELLERNEIDHLSVEAEKKLDFCDLIPDNSIHFNDHVTCVEYTWRKGDFLTSGNRSTASQYILGKLQSYVRQLGWTTD